MKKMNSAYFSGLAALGIIAVFFAMVLIMGVFSGDDGSAEATGTKATSIPTKKASPTSEATPASRGETLSLDPDGIEVRYVCRVKPESTKQAFWSMEEAWAAAPMEVCDAARIDPNTGEVDKRPPSEAQIKALETAYGPDYDPRALYILYGICGQTAGELIDKGGRTAELEGALVLCPDHPKAATMQENIASVKDLIAELQEDKRKTDAGTLVGRGSHLIGVDIQPGTWRSTGAVKDCFWELLDAQGETIEEDYISIASEVIIEVPASATGLRISGCSFELVSP